LRKDQGMASIRKLLRVPAGDTLDLASIDPRATPGLPAKADKRWARARLDPVGAEVAGYQERLYARAKAADDYQGAYADALGRCCTDAAPWYVVPADRKWYRDRAVAQLLRETTADLRLEYPPPEFDVAAEKARLKAA
jgi:hypothetical protein